MIEKIETRYNCVRDETNPYSTDEFEICQSYENRLNVDIRCPEKWRDIDEMIGFYEWVVSELKNFKKQRVKDDTKTETDARI